MRATTPAADSARRAIVTRPLYLIEISFSPLTRISTNGEVTWGGYVWSGGQKVSVEGLTADNTGRQTGTVQIGNLDDLLGAMVLGQGVADRPIRIWSADGAALATDDPELVFTGVIERADVDVTRVSLVLASGGSRSAYVPRRVIGPETGFNLLQPAGTKIKVGKDTYTLERRSQ